MPILLRWALTHVMSRRERDKGIRKLALGISAGRSVKGTGVIASRSEDICISNERLPLIGGDDMTVTMVYLVVE